MESLVQRSTRAYAQGREFVVTYDIYLDEPHECDFCKGRGQDVSFQATDVELDGKELEVDHPLGDAALDAFYDAMPDVDGICDNERCRKKFVETVEQAYPPL